MSVTSTISIIEYNGNGVQTAFPIPFYFMALGDIEVEVAEVVQGYTTNYTISGITDNFGAYPSGGTVNFVAAPTGVVTITRNTPKTTITSFVDGQPLTADAINHAIDRLTLIDQEGQNTTNVVTSAPVVPLVVIGGGTLNLVAGSQWTFVQASSTASISATVNLPPATGSQNVYYVKKQDLFGTPINVTPSGTDTIDGSSGVDPIIVAKQVNNYIDSGAGTWLKF